MFFIRELSNRIYRENMKTGGRKYEGENVICSITYAVIFRSTVDCQSTQQCIEQGFGGELCYLLGKIKMPYTLI